jgi:hypothetical protein
LYGDWFSFNGPLESVIDRSLNQSTERAMSQDLEYLIELAKKHQMTDEERNEQVRSFAYGNTHFENESITRADIDKAMDALNKERASNPVRP